MNIEHPAITRTMETGYANGGISMGEYADMILEGVLCEVCGDCFDDEPPGHTRLCEDCSEE